MDKTFETRVGEVISIYTATADNTIVDTIGQTEMLSATSVGTNILPANFWVEGKTLTIKLEGYLSNVSTDVTVNVAMNIGGQTIGVTRDTAFVKIPDVQDTSYFTCYATITCRTVGVTGTFQAIGALNIYDTNIASYGVNHSYGFVRYDGMAAIDMNEFILDTTVSASISSLWSWGVASSGNTMTITNATITTQ